jgi:hypothetical protein
MSQSACYNVNKGFWKPFGLWPGSTNLKTYRYYSYFYLMSTLIIYMVLLTLNLVYCPKKIDLLIREVIFYFTEWAVVFKVLMMLKMRNKIIEAFNLLDCDTFQGIDEVGKQIVAKNMSYYKNFYRFIAISSHFAFFLLALRSLALWLLKVNVELPVCQYYFLSDDTRNKYFLVWFSYLTLGIYGHMTYNVNVDTLMAGLMSMAITQVKVLKHNFSVMKLSIPSTASSDNFKDMSKLNEQLQHYSLILK